MIRSKNMKMTCVSAIVFAVMIAIALLIGCILFDDDLSSKQKKNTTKYLSTEYVEKIFDDTYVHEIDVILPQVNWDYMVQHALEEQYVLCDVLIDGEKISNVAIRPKGNSSLAAQKEMNQDRFSFKLEFDHYKAWNTYYGLDKLALNNLSSDVSCMKDFISYHMMNEMGIAAPLSSYVQMKLNGEPFGLYLAVEAIEDSFAYRNYGEEFGNIYKPECFNVDEVDYSQFMKNENNPLLNNYDAFGPGDRLDIIGEMAKFAFRNMFGETMDTAALKYMGEDFETYRVIFDSTVFDITEKDKQSFIDAVRVLNSSDNPSDAVDVDEMLRYLVVHNFVNNYDSYTGIFDHNYYVREYNGKLSMIPWDYNLSCGIFQAGIVAKSIIADTPYDTEVYMGNFMNEATSMINYPIDTPTITVDMEERPMVSSVLSTEENLQKYHEYYSALFEQYFDNGKLDQLFAQTYEIIKPYVDAGLTFYQPEKVKEAIDVVYDYCILREQSIKGQLDGTIPSTMNGQKEDYANLVDASDLELYKTITFEGLIMGITKKDMVEILDAIAGENGKNAAGLQAAIDKLMVTNNGLPAVNSEEAINVIKRILSQSSLVHRLLSKTIMGPSLLILSIIIFIIAFHKVKKYQRRKECKG